MCSFPPLDNRTAWTLPEMRCTAQQEWPSWERSLPPTTTAFGSAVIMPANDASYSALGSQWSVALTQQPRLGWWILAGGTAAAAVATLTPDPSSEALTATTSVWCLVCGQEGMADVLANLLLFLPLGIGVGLAGGAVFRAALIGFLVSLAMESLQLTAIAGRDASLSDLVTNTSGAMLGWTLAHHWEVLVLPSARQARHLLLVGSAMLLGVHTGVAFLLQPSLPAGTWDHTTDPDRPGYNPFLGQILETKIGDIPIGSPPLNRAGRERAGLLRGDSLQVTFTTGPISPGIEPVAAVAAGDRQLLAVGRRGLDLEWQIRLRANAWRLRSPRIHLHQIVPPNAGDTVVTWVGVRNGTLYAGGLTSEDRWRRQRPLTVALGWSLLAPWTETFGDDGKMLSLMWVSLLAFPLAYWAQRTQKPVSGLALVVSILLAGMELAPRLLQLPGSSPADWVAAGTGALSGSLVGFYGTRFWPLTGGSR